MPRVETVCAQRAHPHPRPPLSTVHTAVVAHTTQTEVGVHPQPHTNTAQCVYFINFMRRANGPTRAARARRPAPRGLRRSSPDPASGSASARIRISLARGPGSVSRGHAGVSRGRALWTVPNDASGSRETIGPSASAGAPGGRCVPRLVTFFSIYGIPIAYRGAWGLRHRRASRHRLSITDTAPGHVFRKVLPPLLYKVRSMRTARLIMSVIMSSAPMSGTL